MRENPHEQTESDFKSPYFYVYVNCMGWRRGRPMHFLETTHQYFVQVNSPLYLLRMLS